MTAETQFAKEDDVCSRVPRLSKENIIGNRPILDILGRYVKEKGTANTQISHAWMLHKYPSVVPIPSSKNRERILENFGGWNVKLPDEKFAALDACEVHGDRGNVKEHVENKIFNCEFEPCDPKLSD